jgi:hypothetical protein
MTRGGGFGGVAFGGGVTPKDENVSSDVSVARAMKYMFVERWG